MIKAMITNSDTVFIHKKEDEIRDSRMICKAIQ